MEEPMDTMDVSAIGHLRNSDVRPPSSQKQQRKVVHLPLPKKKVEVPELSQQQLSRMRAALDRVIKNTRYSYSVNEKLGMVVVRIIDRDTDNVIKEIPAREIQRMHENIQEAVGLLFDTQI
jgi:flagellar protein FlaG